MEQHKESVIRQLGRMNHSVMRAVEAQVNREVGADISGPQARTLHFISHRSKDGMVCQRDIEEEFDLKPSSVSLLLRNMEERKLIVRRSVEGDGRLKSVQLTPLAEELSHRLMDTLMGVERVLSQGITPEEQDALTAILGKIRKNVNDLL